MPPASAGHTLLRNPFPAARVLNACTGYPFHEILLVPKRERATIIATRNRNSNPRASKTKVPQDNREAPLEVFGSIKQVFPSATFSVELDNGHVVLAHIAGRLRRHHIRILPGDRVDVELSPYDLTKGRIVYRYRAGEARRTS